MSIFNYELEESIGEVFSVDTGTVLVTIEKGEELRKLQVNHLIVLRSARAGQHLIGIINKIMRKMVIDSDDTNEIANSERNEEDYYHVENIVRIGLIGTLIDAVGAKNNVFRRTLETVPEIDAPCFPLRGEKLTEFMHAISAQVSTTNKPLNLGKYTLDDEADAWVDGNKFFQRHAALVGSTGSGKSWTVAKIMEQVADLPNANAILFDIHGEYKPIKGEGISHFRVAGPGDLDGTVTLDDGVVFLPYWLLTYEEVLAMLLDRSDLNAPNQAMVFNREIKKAKHDYLQKLGNDELIANFTIDSPIPYDISTVVEKLYLLDKEMVQGSGAREKQGPFHGKLTRFIQRLESKMEDRRLGFLFDAADDSMDFDWLEKLATSLLGSTVLRGENEGGVKIIDFSEVPSDILPLIIGLVARLVFSIQQWMKNEERQPIALFCDEAHLYIPERNETGISTTGLHAFERIAKEGRKYGVGLVIISQRPSEVSRTVLSQCNNFVAMRLTNAEDQSVIRRLLPDILGGFAELLPILDIGEALAVGDAVMLPSRIRIDEPNCKPSSATVDFWDYWSNENVENGITAAVESLRRQQST